MKASLLFTLTGKLKSGKNHVQITRNGQRYPKKEFKVWRDAMLAQLNEYELFLFEGPVSLIVDYVPGDLLRRDVSGMLDAVFHILEKAGIVNDDAQVKNVQWHQWPMDRQNPQCRVTIEEIG